MTKKLRGNRGQKRRIICAISIYLMALYFSSALSRNGGLPPSAYYSLILISLYNNKITAPIKY